MHVRSIWLTWKHQCSHLCIQCLSHITTFFNSLIRKLWKILYLYLHWNFLQMVSRTRNSFSHPFPLLSSLHPLSFPFVDNSLHASKLKLLVKQPQRAADVSQMLDILWSALTSSCFSSYVSIWCLLFVIGYRQYLDGKRVENSNCS